MKKILLGAIIVAASLQSQAAIEVYKGQSEIGDDGTGKACVVTLDRDEKSSDILSVKVSAPARVYRHQGEVATVNSGRVQATEGREGLDTTAPKAFSQFKFRKLADIQGEGFMLRGEKQVKTNKDEKVFIHFDIQGGSIQGIEFAERKVRKTKNPSDRVYIEKICSGLKKSNVLTR